MSQTTTPSGWCVYLLAERELYTLPPARQGIRDTYVGMTNDLTARLQSHNHGDVRSTRGRTWIVCAMISCKSRQDAAALEAYLKVGSSRQKREAFLYAYLVS